MAQISTFPCQILEGIIAFRIESSAICLYAQMHICFAIIFGGSATFILLCMACTERWPTAGIAMVSFCMIMGIGPEGILALCIICIYYNRREKRSLRTTHDADISERTEAFNGRPETDCIPAADIPVGIPICKLFVADDLTVTTT